MMNEVRLLLKNQLLALFGFNKIRHTGDPGEKHKLTGFLVMMGAVALLLVGMMTLYSVGMAFVLEPCRPARSGARPDDGRGLRPVPGDHRLQGPRSALRL